jgi:hypothetical protein
MQRWRNERLMHRTSVPSLGPGGPFFGPSGPFFGTGVPFFGPSVPFFGPGVPFFGPDVPFFGPDVPFFGPGVPFFGPDGPFLGPCVPFFGRGVPFLEFEAKGGFIRSRDELRHPSQPMAFRQLSVLQRHGWPENDAVDEMVTCLESGIRHTPRYLLDTRSGLSSWF